MRPRPVPAAERMIGADVILNGLQVLSDVTTRVERLTDGQRDCLRLVYDHMTSKDIARTLGVSPHTVDMRLRTAMRTLAVPSRIDAARLLADSEAGQGVYQSLIYQSSDVVPDDAEADVDGPASNASSPAREYSQARPVVGPLADVSAPSAGAPSFEPRTLVTRAGADERRDARHPDRSLGEERGQIGRLDTFLPWGPHNSFGSGSRIAWIAVVAIGSAMGFGAVLGALEALTNLL